MKEKIFETELQNEDYIAWLGSNPCGFVVNQRKIGKDHLMLHRAGCGSISKPDGHHLTYLRKRCFEERGDPENWMKENRSPGHEIRYCSYAT